MKKSGLHLSRELQSTVGADQLKRSQKRSGYTSQGHPA